MYCTGCVSDEIGPTIFLLKGQHCQQHYTDDFLIQYGCQKGSTIIMMPNSFITIEVWEEISPNIFEELCNINPFVKANP